MLFADKLEAGSRKAGCVHTVVVEWYEWSRMVALCAQISFWPQYDALIVQLAQLECCSSKETSRARQKDGILVDSLNELRVVLQSWGRCSDKAATWEFDLGDRILDVQLPRHITARDLEGCSTYFLRKLHKHVISLYFQRVVLIQLREFSRNRLPLCFLWMLV